MDNLQIEAITNQEERKAQKRIRRAVSSLITTHRFFGVLALRMEIEPGDVQTIAGNGINFTYSPEWVNETSFDEIKGCIAHIVFACALKHHVRRGERDYDTWQRASRIATAEILKRDDLWVPESIEPEDLPIEIIYDRLPKSEKPQGGGSQNQAMTGTGDNGQDGSEDPFAEYDPFGQADGTGSRDDTANKGQNSVGDSDNTEHAPESHEDRNNQMSGEVQDAPADQHDEVDQQWDKAAKQAIQIAKTTGSDPGSIEQEFDGQHEYRRDWKDILEEFMRSTAPTDYTWARPNHRFIADGLYLPSLHGEGMGPIVIAIDTSGSVNDKHINAICANIFEITADVQPERIHLVQCDTHVRHSEEFDPTDPPDNIKIYGRGGTRFQPVFDWVEEQGIEPEVLIYMTDLYGSMPKEPDYPVIFAVENEAQAKRVPFGNSVIIDVERAKLPLNLRRREQLGTGQASPVR